MRAGRSFRCALDTSPQFAPETLGGRSVKAGATFIAYLLVQRKGNRRLLFQCMAEPFEMWRCGVRGHGMLKAKRGERCACGATVRVVRKWIDLDEARRIERQLIEDIEIRHYWDFVKSPKSPPF